MSYSNITFRSGLSDKGIKNPDLLKDINNAAKNANVVIDINSTTGGVMLIIVGISEDMLLIYGK